MQVQFFKPSILYGYQNRIAQALSQHSDASPTRRMVNRDQVMFSGRRKHGPKYSRLIQQAPMSPVSHRFKQEVDEVLQGFPEHIQQTLRETDFRFVISKFLTHAFPELSGVHPRGWPEGKTWDASDGMTDPVEHRVGVSEYTYDDGWIYHSDRVKNVVRHEAGHAVDVALNDFSTRDDGFLDAYWKDYQNLNYAQKQEFEYYIQEEDGHPTDGGRQEAFADAFGAVFGGGCTENFKDVFKNTYKYVEFAMNKKQFNSHMAEI